MPLPLRPGRRVWRNEALHPDFVKSLRQTRQTARDVMAAPVVRVTETTEASDTARILKQYRIKRVPVVRDGRIVGIVSRADLLDAIVNNRQDRRKAGHEEPHGMISGLLAALGRSFAHREASAPGVGAPDAKPAGDGLVSVEAFRHLVGDFEHRRADKDAAARHAAAAQRRARIRELIDLHFTDDAWRSVLHRAREAAEHGEKEFLLLRFPSGPCVDDGRAVNSALPDWTTTPRGEAAEIYLRWERDLEPRGFPLAARVLDFPGGKPGDIGLFLVWGFEARPDTDR